MKLKRDIIIISLIIVMLFAVSSVCAVDSEIQSGAYNSTDSKSGVNNNEILTFDNNFDDLNNEINGNTSKLYRTG